MCVFPVDKKKILLLGGQNPALTHFQSSSMERFIRDKNGSYKDDYVLQLVFQLLIVPISLLCTEKQGAALHVGPSPGSERFPSFPFPPVPVGYSCCSEAGVAGASGQWHRWLGLGVLTLQCAGLLI